MNKYIEEKQEKFLKAIEYLKKDLSSLRTGRANSSIFDGVFVEVYESKTALNGLASITVNDSKTILITPWDKGIIKDIEKAIIDAKLGVGVINEGDKIRITIPQTTEENRKELVKKAGEKYEQARIQIRKIRDEIKESIEKAEKEKEISEDDKFRFLKELEEEVKKNNNIIKEIKENKEKDIMTV